MDKSSLRLSKELKSLKNSQEHLNFPLKNPQMVQYERNTLLYPAPIQANRNNSVFVIKDTTRQYRVEKLSSSINLPAYHLDIKNCGKAIQDYSQKVIEMVQQKNQQTKEQLDDQRQSMSQIVYNYSKFRVMQSQYNKNESHKKKSEKLTKKEQSLKFPQVIKQNNDTFTIDYDAEGKKTIKIKVQSSIIDQITKKRSQSLIQGLSNKESHGISSEKYSNTKKKLPIFKYKKLESFGIQIKSINCKFFEKITDYQSKLKLRNQIYELVKDPLKSKESNGQMNYEQILGKEQLQKQSDQNFQKQEGQKASQPKRQFSIKDAFCSNIFPKFKPKYSSTSLSNREYEDLQNVVKSDYLAKDEQTQKQKQNQVSPKKQNPKKSIILYEKETTLYDQKINAYRQFLFMLNLAHKRYDSLAIKDFTYLKNEDKYKFYLGPGNNSMLVKSLMKRRFWWAQEEDYKKSNFSWTQLKIINFYQYQHKSQTKDVDSKIQIVDRQPKMKKCSKKQGQTKSPMKGTLFKPPLPINKDKIFTSTDKKIYDSLQQSITVQFTDKLTKFAIKLKSLQTSTFIATNEVKINQKIHNHLEFNHFIGNKKALFYNLRKYYELRNLNVFEIIPITFHIKNGTKDIQYNNFLKEYKRFQALKQMARKKKYHQSKQQKIKNIWIVKPGQLSNRGNGILVINEVYQLINIFKKKQKHNDGAQKTYIVQKYIEQPLLYKGRKFDIRHYMIITRLHGLMRVYWYGQGYIRTSSFDFDLEEIGDEMIHLTNDAIQKNSASYGKYEEGNKLSYSQFQKYLDQKYQQAKISFAEDIYPKMKAIATDAVKATYLQLDSNNLQHNFEVFGLDFMIDEKFNVWLIEVNTNPCLQISSKLLGRIIPNMLQQAFRLSIDVIFPPPTHYPNSQKYLTPDNPLGRLMYELIFDEARDGHELVELYKNSANIDYGQIMQDEQVYQNEGKQIQLSPDIN